jgi:hypothetical protein
LENQGMSQRDGLLRQPVVTGSRQIVTRSRRSNHYPKEGTMVMEKADEQVADSIRKLSHAASAMAEAIDEGTDVIKHVVKRSGDVAEELLDDTTQRVKRHPVETMAATFALGAVLGGFIGWSVTRR